MPNDWFSPSDPDTGERRHLAVEVAPPILDRVDDLGAYVGLSRSNFVRLSLALADATVTLAALDRQQQTEQTAERRAQVERDLREITGRLAPRPLPDPVMTLSNN